MAKKILCLMLVFCASVSIAATVDTVNIYSAKMKKNIRCVVIIPDNYGKKKISFPVVYLLHGYSGNFSNWINKVPGIKQEADNFQMILVCPDGDYSSWYINSPVDSSMQYETYISKEVPEYIDKHYPTIKDRHARAITGLSMGGYGALMTAFCHSGFFAACGSISGAVNLSYIYSKYDIAKRFGDTTANAAFWNKHLLKNVIQHYSGKDSLAIIMDCGTDDFFSKSNKELHEQLVKLNIPHDYTERPGNHNWDYWRNSIQYQLLFFHNYFDKYYK